MLKEGIFKERLNRFKVKFFYNGKSLEGFLPNSGRLEEILIKGKKIYFIEKNGHFRIFGAKERNEVILLDTLFSNKIVKKILEDSHLDPLKGFEILKEEVKFSNKRLDFLVKKEDKKYFLEVKTCTLFNKNFVFFPDAPTKRGKEHIEILEKTNGLLIFLIPNSKIRYFLPNFQIDSEFSKKLYTARNKIKIIPVVIKINKNLEFKVIRIARIPWKIYEENSKNKGSYIISGFLNGDKKIKIGRIGYLNFKRGWYLYVGSGMAYLKERVKRHFKKNKKKHWHIDYLIPDLKNLKAFLIHSSKSLECEISMEISKISNGFIEKFGSTDCNCKSHLLYFKKEPTKNPSFIKLLNFFYYGNFLIT